MFNFLSREKEFEFQREIDDLRRHLEYVNKERLSDAEVLRTEYELKKTKDLEMLSISANKSSAEKDAAEAKAKQAEECAAKCVSMAEKCAADFANATGKMMENMLLALEKLKPCAPGEVRVLPVIANSGDVCVTQK